MKQPYLLLRIIDFDVNLALTRLMLNHWSVYHITLDSHSTLCDLEDLGIILIEAASQPHFRGTIQIALTDFGHKCWLCDYAAELYIPIEE